MSGPSSRLRLAIFVSLAALAGPDEAAARQGPLVFSRERVLPVTMTVQSYDRRSPSILGAGPGLVWRGRVSHDSPVPSIRVHVTVVGAAAGWRLVVRSEETGRVVDTYDANSPFVKAGSFWTRDVAGSIAMVDLEATAPLTGLEIRIDQYAFQTMPALKQAIHGIDGRLKIGEASQRIRTLALPIVRLRIMAAGIGEVNCTGFLVSDDLVITNEHCVTSSPEAQATLVDFGYDDADPAETIRAVERVAFDADLDYAVIQLERKAPARWGRVTLDLSDPIEIDLKLIVIQHPLGGFKQASIESCVVSDKQMSGISATPTDFGHKCDTLVGSSGSPVIALSSGAVVGLHHLGFDPVTNTYVNRAVHLDLIAGHLKKTWGKVRAFP